MFDVLNVYLYAFIAINFKAFLITSSFGLTKYERKNYSSWEHRKKGTSGLLYQHDLALFRVVALIIFASCIFCLAQLQRQKWNKFCLALQMTTKAFWMIQCTKPWVYQTLWFLNSLCFLLSTSVISFSVPNWSCILLISNIEKYTLKTTYTEKKKWGKNGRSRRRKKKGEEGRGSLYNTFYPSQVPKIWTEDLEC